MIAALLLAVALAQAPDCSRPGRNTPAFPAPECVTATGAAIQCSTPGAVRLWPSDIRPARPGVQLPPRRDSTDRVVGNTVPSRRFGHEVYSSVAAVDTMPRRLYAAYSGGLQAWSIEGSADPRLPADAADPRELGWADGWAGEWAEWPAPSERLHFLEDVAALRQGSRDVIATAGEVPVMASIWTADVVTGRLTQRYQDRGTGRAFEARLGLAGGRAYALVAGASGVTVYDATAAALLTRPCVETGGETAPGEVPACPGVYQGVAVEGPRQYLDVATVGDSLWVATSHGFGQSTALEVWELAGRAPRPVLALGSGREGAPAFLWAGERLHLAWISEAAGPDREALRLADVDDCRRGPCTVDLDTVPSWSLDPPGPEQDYATRRDPLRASGGYLWRGVATGGLRGPRQVGAWLWRVGHVAGTPTLTPVGVDGGTYADPCNRSQGSYWSRPFSRNAWGLNEYAPKIAVVAGDPPHLYVAAGSVLEVHALVSPALPPPSRPPLIFADGFESGGLGRWLGERWWDPEDER